MNSVCFSRNNKSVVTRNSFIKEINRLFIILIILAFFLTGIPAFCDIYKWTDENGIVHFSNTTVEDSDLWQKEKVLPDDRDETHPLIKQKSDTSDAKKSSDFVLDGGVLWKIVTPSGKVNHIMGTVHSEDPRIVMLPDHFYKIFEYSKSFTMETILDPEAALHLSSAMLYMDGNNLQNVIGMEMFQEVLRAASGRGIPESGLLMMRPWAVMAILSMPESQTGQFLDLVLYENAVSMDKKIHELETTEEQLSVSSDMSDQDQAELLKGTLKQLNELGNMNERIIELYLKDDLRGIADLASYYNDASGNPGFSKKFMNRINDQRNIRMVKRLASILESGNGFIAVGALHLTGENGILKLLKEKGCQLTHIAR